VERTPVALCENTVVCEFRVNAATLSGKRNGAGDGIQHEKSKVASSRLSFDDADGVVRMHEGMSKRPASAESVVTSLGAKRIE
jgi:hypothetical protein